MNYTHTIILQAGRQKRLPVLFEDIVRLEGQGNYTIFTLRSGKEYITSHTLRSYEEALSLSGDFVRIHKNCIINLAYLEKFCTIQRVVQLKDGSTIGIARRRWPIFRKIIQNLPAISY